MHTVTFDFLGQHRHGTAFHEFLRLRKAFFVDGLHWDIPHNDDVEMDQYDNPTAHYSLVLDEGRVIGGARIMATTASWGQHTYMLRDALRGRLHDIPASVMPSDVSTNKTWECTRLVVSDDLASPHDRADCLSMIIDGLVDIAISNGGVELLALMRPSFVRALRQLGFSANMTGEPYRSVLDGHKYAVLQMPAMRSSYMMAAE